MAGPIAFYAPDPIQSTQLIPGGNTPASGAQLFVYQVGTSTKQNSYTDPSASTARTNPIVLDSGGNIPGNGEVWLVSSAKFVLAPSNDTDPPTSPYWTRDNVPGINDVAAQIAAAATTEWVQGSTGTFVGVTQFSVVGDQTALYTLGRRVKIAVTGGDRYGIVTSAAFSTGTTTVGITTDSGTLNGGLSSVQYGMLSTPNGSVPWQFFTSSGINTEGSSQAFGPLTFLSVAHNDAQTTVTSSANPNIWTGGNLINFTGTTPVSSFANAPQAGTGRTLLLASSVSFVSSGALNANYDGIAGDRVDIYATSTTTFNLYAQQQGGPALVYLASSGAPPVTSNVAFFSSTINSRFDEYEFHLHKVLPASNGANLLVRLSTDNGVTWAAAAGTSALFSYRYTGAGVDSAGVTFNQFQANTTEIIISVTSGVSNDLTQTVDKVVKLYAPSDTSGPQKQLTFIGGGGNTAVNTYHIVGGGRLIGVTAGTTAINAIQFLFKSGNVSTGNFYVYGYRRV